MAETMGIGDMIGTARRERQRWEQIAATLEGYGEVEAEVAKRRRALTEAQTALAAASASAQAAQRDAETAKSKAAATKAALADTVNQAEREARERVTTVHADADRAVAASAARVAAADADAKRTITALQDAIVEARRAHTDATRELAAEVAALTKQRTALVADLESLRRKYGLGGS